jgi:murein hydrolase activator
MRPHRGVWWSLPLFLMLLLSAFQTGQTQGKADQAKQQLDRLRSEIKEYEKRLTETRSREKDLLGELEDLEREVALRTELVQKLQVEQQRTQEALETSGRELQTIEGILVHTRQDSLRTELDRGALNDLVARRAVYTYKHFHRDLLKAALTSGSLMQWLTRQEYLRRIAAVDNRNLDQLERKNQRLAALGNDLVRRQTAESSRLLKYQEIAAYNDRLLKETSSAAAKLQDRRADREKLLTRLRKDRDLIARQLQEKKDAALQVENLIKSLESKRAKATTLLPLPKLSALDLPFPQMRGKLAWPTQGEVVGRFGLQRHEKLATVTENPGIDIEASEGTPVISVSSGEVTKITWLRGYGNTVIVDHREGYYTVYAHLGQIQVREGQVVRTGEALGRIGQSGSTAGPRLHFEVWVKREKQDPLDWLAGK